MIDDYYNNDFVRLRYVKDNRGRVLLTAQDQFRGRIELKPKTILNSDGEEQLASARIFCGYGDDIQVGDRVYFGIIPDTETGTGTVPERTFAVIASQPHQGFGPSHKQVYIG